MDSSERLQLICPGCGRKLTISASAIGRVLRCPGCSAAVPIAATPDGDDPEQSSRLLVTWVCITLVCVAGMGVAFALNFRSPELPVTESETASSTNDRAPIPKPLQKQVAPNANSELTAEPQKQLNKPAKGWELAEGSVIQLDQLAPMTGRDWIKFNDADRRAVIKGLAMLIIVTDTKIDLKHADSIGTYLDDFYASESDLDTKITKAAEGYMIRARGILLHASASGNMTTDSFVYPGDGYLIFKCKAKSAVYGVSVYDHATARIVKANVLTHVGGNVQPELMHLRLPAGAYYLEVVSSQPWELLVVDQRGFEYLNRKLEAGASE